jgi:hypothetical protein
MPYILKAIRATLDDVANGIDDKLLFSEHCLEHGIAVQSNIVLAKKSRVMWCRGNEKLPASDLVIKRTHLAGGQGVEVWEFAEKDRTWTRDGREFDEAGFLNHVSKSAADEDLIVQARLRNEKTIRDLVGPGLSTIRVLSARYRDEHPFVVAATMRMPVGGNLVDNLSGGGIAANVCLESGIVRKAVSRDIQDGWITTHPDSGLSIEGFQIPDLQQATDLCVKAHAEFGNYPAIGWDAVITEAGPLLLEGNTLWGQELHQETPGNIALGSTKLLAILADSIPSTDSAASAP